MIFIANFIFILIYGLIIKNKIDNKKTKIIFLTVCFFVMFLIQALRDSSVGSDTIQYVNIYDNYKTSEVYSYLFTHYDWGIQLIIRVFSGIGFDSQLFIAFLSMIIMVGFSIFIYKNSKNYVLSTLVFAGIFYPNSFNVIRQYVACAIAINSFYYFKNKKYIRSLIIVLFSLLFHKISLIILVPYLFSLIKDRKIQIAFLFLFVGVAIIFNNMIISYFLELFRGDYYTSGDFDSMRIFRMSSLLVLFYAIVILYTMQWSKEDEMLDYKIVSSFSLVNLIFGFYYLKNEIFSRIIELLNLHLLLSISLVINVSRRGKYYLIYRAVAVSLIFFLMIMQVFNSQSGVESYSFFF